jgi:P27 family predicted phage terminase small subunit
MSNRGPKPPDHLTENAKTLWRKVNAEYDLAPHDLERLRCVCEAVGRMDAAREVLDRDGVTFTDRNGAPRPRPENGIERDSRLAVLRGLRELGLDLSQDEPAPRPPARYK